MTATALLLGPVGVTVGERFFAPRSALSRALLAVLALECGRVVADEALVKAVWGSRPPDSRSAVAVAVHRLRQWLRDHVGESAELARAASGYVLSLGGGTDLDRFRALVTSASTMDTEAAAGALEEALACWRGAALADIPSDFPAAEIAARLNRERQAAALDLSHLLVRTGRARHAVELLEPLAAGNPLDEQIHGGLIEALAASGRQADALEVYQRIRGSLADDLGVDPGQQLQQVYVRVLRQQVPTDAPPDTLVHNGYPLPSQLPNDVVRFTGRGHHLSELDALLASQPDPTAAIVCTIAGTAGVGKTALAVHWARSVRDRFPDGQLYINLHGYSRNQPVQAVEALGQFLRALGVSAHEVPLDTQEAASMYRSLLADRRMLVLLDNAVSPDQIRLLLPGGAGCLALITSRDRLTSLVAMEGARRLMLDVMPVEEATELLAKTVGAARVAAEPVAAGRLAEACARLPLALRVAAANLADAPHESLADYAARLCEGDRLAMLDLDGEGDGAVRSTFYLSYRRLGAAEQRMFRLLGLVPGPDVSAQGAAALAGVDLVGATLALNRLVATHMVDRDQDGRFSFHDLLRAYAHDVAHHRETAKAQEAATTRLFDWYQATAGRASQVLFPERMRLPAETESDAFAAGDARAREEALAWLAAELPNLIQAIRHAASSGPQPLAWRLTDSLRGYLELRRYLADWFAIAEVGMAAAHAQADAMGQAAMHQSLSYALGTVGEDVAAAEHCVAGLAHARRAGWHVGEAGLLAHLGGCYLRIGRLGEAADCVKQAAAIHQRAGNPAGEAVAIGILATIERRSGDLAGSVENGTRALVLYREIGSRNGEARALNVLGNTLRAIGRFDESVDRLTDALSRYRELEDRDGEVCALDSLASAYRDAGRYEVAAVFAQASLDLAEEISYTRVGIISLNTLGSIQCGLRDYTAAAELHERALILAMKSGTSADEVEALIGLAVARHHLGEFEDALRDAEQALAVSRRDHLGLLEAQALTARAAIHLSLGKAPSAIDDAVQALALHRAMGQRLGEMKTIPILEEARRQASAAR